MSSNVTTAAPRAIPEADSLRSGLVLAALGVLAFSFSVPMTKVAVGGLPPLFLGMGRATVAGALAVMALRSTGAARPTARQAARLVVVAGGVVFGFPIMTAYALHHVPSAHGSVVTGLLPLVTAGVAVVRAGERPSFAYWSCSVLGLGAVVFYVARRGGGSFHLADVLLVLAVVAAAVGYAEGALLSREMPAWRVISWTLVLALPLTTPLAVASLVTGDPRHATVGQWAAFGYTALFSMFLGFFAWYAGLARAGIARAGQLQLAQPALALIWAWPLLGERPDALAAVTVAVVLLAVWLGRRSVVR
jgi:drug/metabolite transporter (DMT)-like permease